MSPYSMNADLEIANDHLSKGSYQTYHNLIKLYHLKHQSPESTDLLSKSTKMLNTYKDLQNFLKIDSNDYYKILNIPKNFSNNEITSKYKQLMFKYHPNVTKVKECNVAIQRIQQAYSTLNDSEKRRLYDNRRKYEGMSYDTANVGDYVDFYEVLRRRMESRSGVYFTDWSNEFVFSEMYESGIGRGRGFNRVRREERNGISGVTLFIILIVLMLLL